MPANANRTFPYELEGVKVFDNIDELMVKYYRRPDDFSPWVAAIEVGRIWNNFLAARSAALVNVKVADKKMSLPSEEAVYLGYDALILDLPRNEFWQQHSHNVLPVIQTEIINLHTSSKIDDAGMIHAFAVTKWSFLSAIAGCCAGGSSAAKDMDLEMRKYTGVHMKAVLDILSKIGRGESIG